MNEHDAIERIKRLSHNINCADEIAEVIERLINERDEARRIACGLMYDQAPSPATKESIAEAEGWDCFKEDGK